MFALDTKVSSRVFELKEGVFEVKMHHLCHRAIIRCNRHS